MGIVISYQKEPTKRQVKELAKKIIDTNPHLRTKKKRIEKVAKSQSILHKIEGINVSRSKIKHMLYNSKNGSELY